MNSTYNLSPQQIASEYIRMLNSVPAQKIAQVCLDSSNNITFENLNRYAYGHPKIKEVEHYYREGLTNQKTKEELLSDWNEVLATKWSASFKETINQFIQKWAVCPLSEAMDMIWKAGEELEAMTELEQMEEDWAMCLSEDNILLFNDFIENFPNGKYRNEAEKMRYTLKQKLLSDLKTKYPFYYPREEMYSYISSGVLTFDDLVTNSNILSEDGYRHIKIYPHMFDESAALPAYLLEGNKAVNGNTDILPFGMSGSGGKTCLLAALMTLFDNKTFMLHESYGAVYARYLSEIMFRNCLPPATVQSYIQVINTSLRGDNDWHGVTFVEFSGEKAAEIAGDDEKMFVSGNTGNNLFNLLNNNNRKILLFALDLTNKKECLVWAGGYNDEYLSVFQSDVAELWAYRLKKDREFCRKISAIKIVVTKKDIINVATCQQAINAIVDAGYKVFYDTIVEICHEYGIMEYNNFMPEVIPFCIGKFMPGDVYHFDDSDAKILLDSIRRDLDSNYSKKGITNQIRKIFKYKL